MPETPGRDADAPHAERLAWRQDMTITRDEFLRTLAMAFRQSPLVVDGAEIRSEEGGRGWRITLVPLADLELGQFRLPRHQVTLHLAGYDPDAARAFVDRFEFHFRRGGG